MPFSCTMNARYVVTCIVIGMIYIGLLYENLKNKNIKYVIMGIVILFEIISLLALIYVMVIDKITR